MLPLQQLENILESAISSSEYETFIAVHDHLVGFINMNNYAAPFIDPTYALPKTHGLLREYLEQYFSHIGLLLNGKFVRAAGFLSSKTFNALNQAYALVIEDLNFMGASMMHGKLTHAIQLWVLSKEIEAGKIILPNGMSFAELIKHMNTDKTEVNEGDYKNKRTVFEVIFDNSAHTNFQSALFTSSFIMKSEKKLPLLSALLRISLTKHVAKNNKIQFEGNIPHSAIIMLQMMARHLFMDMTSDALEKIAYYQRQHTQHDLRKISLKTEADGSQGLMLSSDNIIGQLEKGAAYIKNAGCQPKRTFKL